MFQSVYGVNYKWFPLVAILFFKMAANKMKKNAYISSKLLGVSIFSEGNEPVGLWMIVECNI